MRAPIALEGKSILDTPGGDVEVNLIREEDISPLGGLADGDDDDVENNNKPYRNMPPKQFEAVPRRTLLALVTWPFTAAMAFFRSRIYYNINVEPTTTHHMPNYICALSAWLFTGAVAAWMGSVDPAKELTPIVPVSTGFLLVDSAIDRVVYWRHSIYFTTLVIACFIGLADRRGGLPGLLFRRHFNLFLQFGRILTLLSMIGTSCVVSTLSTTCLVQISVLWMAGFVCKMLSSYHQGYYYAICTFMWNNCTSGAIVLMYLCSSSSSNK
jgi:hypothetical protein